ncbi:MAG: protein-(glutamine-N5) methyltransferase, release factor-specific [Candidatus Moranbacteria bacterium RIFOXYA12_FULL_35_19]|nr:MAG: Release factor glutamine methyltransferase [Candidatus Moranbacteria bacterium GW2011_GWF2_35_39]OGI31895.1 MAG: protein-(glutamine-N5) methyltransferase, release factor-specific [Candidatus Moranbacteria bacterium RIFOXYB12_FULL_35_8]OGI32333.1 MAG: protein-(glutamine-N5) methyltransferase, release factor-specific [Candidatus Moranbacteria bacterium RIFOXYC12_FULL_36_13]OGI36593.1 MAG: protein-(glutamine-N5) methyltransferase, release factor-specific [Candidatus Moranbacteria bacterium 
MQIENCKLVVIIKDYFSKYSSKINHLDLELLISCAIRKPREFVLAHPEKSVSKEQRTMINKLIRRRLKHEPIAYILGQKEFYGLNFKVNKHTLIPRPETEHLVDAVISNLQLVNSKKTTIVDIGTGSGNIIISLAKNLWTSNVPNGHSMSFFGVDISQKALIVAKHNAKKHNVDKKIKFIRSNLLDYFIKNKNCYMFHASCSMIIVANLPYLSKKIYSSSMPNVKKFEPRSALLSGIEGLDHYEKLFKQLHKLEIGNWKLEIFLEISPEQKSKIAKLIKKYFPNANIEFQKDLAQKWRVAIVEI